MTTLNSFTGLVRQCACREFVYSLRDGLHVHRSAQAETMERFSDCCGRRFVVHGRCWWYVGPVCLFMSGIIRAADR